MNFENYLETIQKRMELTLSRRLPILQDQPTRLHEAMHYAVLGGGKRLRPLLVYATGELFNLDTEPLDDIACAIEFIHAYSLIHDDLPAMDNDSLRRGRPTCHCAFDEATAILAGDALQTLAFQTLAQSLTLRLKPEKLVKIIHFLAQASGSKGMAGGQSLDMSSEKMSQIDELKQLHRMKTGALIHASVLMAAIAAHASKQQQQQLSQYAQCIGLAFQIKDDILDEIGSAQLTGKQPGKDRKNHKSTYTTLLGLEDAKDHLQDLIQQALLSLESFGQAANKLRDVTHFIMDRQH